MDEVDRIATRTYEPSDDDVVRARLRTVGVQEYTLKFENVGACLRSCARPRLTPYAPLVLQRTWTARSRANGSSTTSAVRALRCVAFPPPSRFRGARS